MSDITQDLAAWLTAVWDEDEAEARQDKYRYDAWWMNGPFDADFVLARIAADKEILRLHSGDNDAPCQSYAGNWVTEPCDTLKALASPYESRPGFRSEWLVEQQGVEG